MSASASSATTKTIVGILVVAALAVAFWVLLLGPQRQKADTLQSEVEAQRAPLSQAQNAALEANAAKQQFGPDYRRLVVLGQAVPNNAETSALLVELSKIAKRTHVSFEGLQLSGEGTGGEATVPTAAEASATNSVPTSSTVPPTEAEAALLPLGAQVGSAGLGVMPYSLTFEGGFFQIAHFIHAVDDLVRTGKHDAGVDGRLITIDGFSLSKAEESSSNALKANFSVTTYLVPPGQGTTAGASSEGPAVAPTETAVPEGETTTAAPSSFSTGAEEAR